MQAQGNDFVILDGLNNTFSNVANAHFAKEICDRHTGIGCDQLLVLEPSKDADALMLIYNADGSQASNCGNGLRCVALLLMNKTQHDDVSISLLDRVVKAKKTKFGVQINMGEAVIEDKTPHYTDVDMGNAHRVYFEDVKDCPERNVEIVSYMDDEHVNIRIIERGTGETLACGSGACAAAVAVWDKSGFKAPLTVQMPGGKVVVSQQNNDIYLEGDVAFVFKGEYTTI
ncbi:MAG: diaminopimelate epimerase [Ghiorsea sp.]